MIHEVVIINVTIFTNTNYYIVCYHQYRPHYGNCTVPSYLCCSIHYVVPKCYQEVYCCDCLTRDPGYEFLTTAGRWKLKDGCFVPKIDLDSPDHCFEVYGLFTVSSRESRIPSTTNSHVLYCLFPCRMSGKTFVSGESWYNVGSRLELIILFMAGKPAKQYKMGSAPISCEGRMTISFLKN